MNYWMIRAKESEWEKQVENALKMNLIFIK
jgi:hypothetical protein